MPTLRVESVLYFSDPEELLNRNWRAGKNSERSMENCLHTSSCWECMWHTSSSVGPSRALLRQGFPTFWHQEPICGRQFFRGWRAGMVWGWFKYIFIVYLFLLLHQLYPTSSDTRSLRLGDLWLRLRRALFIRDTSLPETAHINVWSTWLDRGLDSLLQCSAQ